MKTLALTAAFIAMAIPAYATNLDSVPKDVLIGGLQTTAVCATIDGYGIKRLVKFYNDGKSDSTEEGSSAEKAAMGATALYQMLKIDVSVGDNIVETLKRKYQMSDDDLSKALKDVVEAEDGALADTYDKIDNYDDFNTKYTTALDSCTNSVKSFMKEAKPYIGGVEIQD